MLVLRSHVDDGLTIQTPNGEIHIVIFEVATTHEGKTLRKPSVTLGINAPKNFAIHRDNAKEKRSA